VQTKVRSNRLRKFPAAAVTRPSWLARPGWLPKRRRKTQADRAAGPGRAHDIAGRAFARLTAVPAVLVASWLLTGLPLLLLGDFLPVPTLLISAPLATALTVNVLQRVPTRWPSEFPGKAADRAWMPWFGLLGTAFVAGGFVGWQLAKNSASVIATRTPGAYFQTGYWLAQHGSLPIPGSLKAFGGPHPGLHLSSIGFFAHGHSVVPGVVAGLPMLLASGFWTSGVGGGTIVMPVLGGLAIFAFGGLVGRLAGRQWAPAGALVLAVTMPELYTSRDAFSEPAVQVLLFGGLCLLVDALTWSRVARAEPAQAVKEDPVAKTLRLAEAVIAGGSAGTADAGQAANPGGIAEAGKDGTPEEAAGSDATVPIPAVTASKPVQAGLLGLADRWSRRAQTSLLARAKRAVAWSRTANWRTVWARLIAGLTAERMLAGLGGIALGLTSLLNLGSLVYLLPVIAVAGVLLVARRAVGVAFSLGVCLGCGYGIAAGYLLARPFADTLASPLRVIGLDAAGIAVVTAMVIVGMRRARVRRVVRKVLGKPPLRWLPGLASFAVIVALGGLAARPYIQTVRAVLGHAEADFVAGLQRLAGLKIDPTRLYSEDTLYWVIWYAGIATVLLAAFGGAVLVRRSLRALLTWNDPSGTYTNWALPVAIVVAGSAAILWQPFTVPDQPWASRRLVPVVIPGMILLATWAAAWLARRARDRGAGQVTSGIVSAFCVGAMVLPAFTTSLGLGLTHSGIGGGLRLSTKGIAQHAVHAGETAAVRALCASIGRSSSVVILDRQLAGDFTQVVRGMCGVPVAWMPQGSPPTAVDAVLAGILKAGRRPVLLGAKPAEITGFGGSPTLVMKLATTQDPHELTQAPGGPLPAKYVIWMAVDQSSAVGT
jgi:hypothetical protein